MVVDNPLIRLNVLEKSRNHRSPPFKASCFCRQHFSDCCLSLVIVKNIMKLHVATIKLDMGTDCPSPDHLLMTQTAEICRSSWHSGRRVGLGLPALGVMAFGEIYEWIVEDSKKNVYIIYKYYTVHTHSSLSKSFGPNHFRLKCLVLYGWNPSL